MEILREIERDIVDSKTPLSSILRKARILASKLKNEEFKLWVDQELDGYDKTAKLPKYRILPTKSYGYFVGAFGRQLKNAPIPTSVFPEDIREQGTKIAETHPITDGVKALETLMESEEKDFQSPWPANLVALIGNRIYEDMNCLHIWKTISNYQIGQVLDTIRNSLLKFIIEIECSFPNLTESIDRQDQNQGDKITQIFNNYILGDKNITNTGILKAKSVDITIQVGDILKLESVLKKAGLESEDVKKLVEAIKSDGKMQGKSLGENVKKWLSYITEKIISGGLGKVGQELPTLIMQIISQYYGLQ